MVCSTPWPHFTLLKDPVPIFYEAGWAPGPVWTDGKCPPQRDSIPERPARSSVAIPTELPGPRNFQLASRIFGDFVHSRCYTYIVYGSEHLTCIAVLIRTPIRHSHACKVPDLYEVDPIAALGLRPENENVEQN